MATEHRMIEPFEPGQVRNGKISYGVSSYGYDMHVTEEYIIFTNAYSAIVDPKNFDPRSMVEYTHHGHTTPLPAKIYSNEGIAQVLFFKGDEPCETTCAGKKGKHQKQQSIVLPKL